MKRDSTHPKTTEAPLKQDMMRAIRLADRIRSKVHSMLAPMVHEMKIMKWPGEYRAIMWEAVAREAMNRAEEARRGI